MCLDLPWNSKCPSPATIPAIPAGKRASLSEAEMSCPFSLAPEESLAGVEVIS